jgi:ectoine hydroxylase-related dioxygenase (phytanoyl-CoA dioxygenase family)
MPQSDVLSPAQVDAYRRRGYVSPIRVISEADACGVRQQLEDFERAQGSPLKGGQRNKSYLLFPFIHRVLTNARVLDAVEQLIGSDILCYHATTWIKEARSPSFVSWHQDSTYFGLEPVDYVTAWIALSTASVAAGCLRVLPDSFTLGQLDAALKPDANNLLSSGQVVQLNFDESKTVAMPLTPGEMSLHHACTVHGSAGNDTADRRIGLCFHYVPATAKPNPDLIRAGALCSAMLVRGRAHHDHFPPEEPPRATNDVAAIAEHAKAVQSYREMVGALGHRTAHRLD